MLFCLASTFEVSTEFVVLFSFLRHITVCFKLLNHFNDYTAAYRVVNANLWIQLIKHRPFPLSCRFPELLRSACHVVLRGRSRFYLHPTHKNFLGRLFKFTFTSIFSARRIIICRGDSKSGFLYWQGFLWWCKIYEADSSTKWTQYDHLHASQKLWLQVWGLFGDANDRMATSVWLHRHLFCPSILHRYGNFPSVIPFADSIIFQPGRCVIDPVFIAFVNCAYQSKHCLNRLLFRQLCKALLLPWFESIFIINYYGRILWVYVTLIGWFDRFRLIRHQ